MSTSFEASPSTSTAADAVTAGLTPAQAEAAAHDGAVLVLAGAGTGKTRTLVAAAAWRLGVVGLAAHRLLAVTFTNKAAREMSERLQAVLAGQPVPSWVGTFHGLGARQLRIEPEVAELRPGFDILDADDSRRLVKRTLKALRLDAEEEASGGRDPVKAICTAIGKLKDHMIAPEEAAARVAAMVAQANSARTAIDAGTLQLAAQVYPEYQRRLREANAADFGDLLMWPARAMQHDARYRQRWQDRFDCVLTDEYQDVCYVQYVWLRLLAAGHGHLFAVGDDDQSIYSFRSADITLIRRFARDFPAARQVRLEDNFRSTGHILAAANAVIALDPERLGKTLRPTKAQGEPVEVVGFRNPEDEATGLVAEIKRRGGEGVGWQEMAVLYRASHMSRPIEEALMRGHVPYVLVGDLGFYQRQEIKDALALLRLAANPDQKQSDEAFRRVCNTPARGLGPKALALIEEEAARQGVSLLAAAASAKLPAKAGAAAAAFAGAIRSVAEDARATLADQLSLLLDRTGYRAMLRDSRAEAMEDRLENLQELLELAAGFHSAGELLDHAALASAAPGEDTAGRVQLMTLHKGKGLEFAHVFLPGWEVGTFPSVYGLPAEERRLAYVALTRGMSRVAITHCDFRRGYVSPSRFIADIPPEHRVEGWLRQQGRSRRTVVAHLIDELDAAALLRHF